MPIFLTYSIASAKFECVVHIPENTAPEMAGVTKIPADSVSAISRNIRRSFSFHFLLY
jgi:hypothetical protein